MGQWETRYLMSKHKTIAPPVYLCGSKLLEHVAHLPVFYLRQLARAAIIVFCMVTGGHIHAAAKIWIGNNDANWSTGSNWGGTAPIDNDTLTFANAGTAGTTLTNNLTSPTFTAGIVFNGITNAGTSAYMIAGNPLIISVNAPASIVNNGNATLTFNNNILINGARTFNTAASDIVINGIISSLNTVGAGGITKIGGGKLTLAGANINSGPTTNTAGTISISTIANGAINPGSLCTLLSGNNFFTYTGTNLDTLTVGQTAFFPSLGSGLINPVSPGTTITSVDAGNKRIYLSANLAASYTGTAGFFGTPAGLGLATSSAANLVFSGNSTLQYTGPNAATDRAFTISAGITATIEVVNAATTLTMTGGMSATTGALAKVGGGTLAFTNAWLHTGGTTISAGTLQLNGSLASGCIVTNNATLTGSGIVNGAVSIAAGANLRPGLDGSDTSPLTINGTLTLSGTTIIAINRTNAIRASTVTGITSLNRGGTLTVTNVGQVLQVGDTFTLFNAGSMIGTFTATNLPPLTAGLNWWTGSSSATVVDYSVNQAPTAYNLSMTATSGIPAALKIIGGQNPPTGEPGEILTIDSVTQGANGTVTQDGTNVTYAASINFAGADNFNYTVSDGHGGWATATVTVTVVPGSFNRLVLTGFIGNGTTIFNYQGAANFDYTLDWATNLGAPIAWMPIATNTTDENGRLSFSKTSPAPVSFFRAHRVIPPSLPPLLGINVTNAPYSAIPNDGLDDSAAFQSALNALKTAGGGYLFVPNGDYLFSSLIAITNGDWGLTIQGESVNARLFCNNSQGVFRLSHLTRGEQITFQDLTFLASTAGAGTAIEVTSPPGGVQEKRVVTVDNVVIRATAAANYFNKGIVVIGVYRPLIMNSSFIMPTTNDFSDASVNFRSAYGYDVTDCYAAVIQNCSAIGAETAFNYATTNTSANPEDGAYRNCTADYCKFGVVHWEISGGREPTLWITDCNLRTRDYGATVLGRRILQITGNTFRQLSATNALTDVYLGNDVLVCVRNNTFAGSLAGGRINILVQSPASDIILGSNILSSTISSSISVDPAAVRVYTY